VRRLLVEARGAGVRLAIATTAAPDAVRALLRHALAPDAERWFAVIAAGDVVGAKKPAPDVYRYALQRLGVAAAECVAFEDSENGLRAALAAGLATVVTVNAYTGAQDFRGAALVLDHLGDPGHPARVLGGSHALAGTMVDLAALAALLRGPPSR
jgi:beta-phosphoglucomutase-like phosphatase (HAD superfamily)